MAACGLQCGRETLVQGYRVSLPTPTLASFPLVLLTTHSTAPHLWPQPYLLDVLLGPQI